MTTCCPDEDRIPASTREGYLVLDLHSHQKMLRGQVVYQDGSKQTIFWYKNGRFTPIAETGRDLVFGQIEGNEYD